jgi:hypothetical protein
LGLSQFWGAITLCADLRSKWGLEQSCSPHWKISNGMSYFTNTQGNWGDSQLLIIRNFGPFFGHNLCFKCPNESCKPILDIYVPRNFQWYNELFNPMGFDYCNHSMKIQGSIGTPTPKVGAHLGVWGFIPSHSPILPRACNVTPDLHTWPAPL